MTKQERLHYEKLATIGCIACRVLGYGFTPTEIHHLRHEAGAGKKSPYFKTIPLCVHHHRLGGYGVAYHAGRRAFEQSIGYTEIELLELTNQLLERIENGTYSD